MSGAPAVETRYLPEPPPRVELTLIYVSAQTLQNVFGGLGLMGACVAAAWLMGITPADAWPYAAALGGIGAGVATAARAWADDWIAWSTRRAWDVALADYEQEIARQDDEMAALRAHVRTLEFENSKLRWAQEQRRAPSYTAPVQAGDQSHNDAWRMLRHYYAGSDHPGVRTMAAWGWGTARRETATELLVAAGVLDMRTPTHPRWPLDAEAAAAQLSRYFGGVGARDTTTPQRSATPAPHDGAGEGA